MKNGPLNNAEEEEEEDDDNGKLGFKCRQFHHIFTVQSNIDMWIVVITEVVSVFFEFLKFSPLFLCSII